MTFASIGFWASFAIVLCGFGFLSWLFMDRAWRAAGELVYPARRLPTTRPSDYGLAPEPITVQTPNGGLLHGWYAPAPDNAKGTIICCHGYAGDCSPDLVYAPLFNRAGYNVCLFDFVGHGTSEGDRTSLVYYERRDLLAVLEYLRKRGVDRVGLIGFSMGGAIALSTAPLSPMVIGVVSDSTFAELQTAILHATLERGIPAFLSRFVSWLVIFLAGVRVRANLFSADPIHAIGKISPRPVLIIHGQADSSIPVSDAYLLYQAAREPKELWIVPNANHRMIEEVAAEEYRWRIVDFFDRAFNTAPARTPALPTITS